jgi:ribonuclease E
MSLRMLIDARHAEETRVAVVKGNRIEELDFESSEHKQIKGNIYLAKVTRVEPSLQAAFVEYGGNRHGFLAFSEIHPDYYQIPKEDREALLREEAAHAEEEARRRDAEDDEDDDSEPLDAHHDDDGSDDDRPDADAEEEDVPPAESVGAEDDSDHSDDSDARAQRMSFRKRYKIQDVIHRRQVLLIQVVKEERGNKGAALTSYLSLAGRYCVLMPNSTHGGGISRKISNGADRKRLKSIMADLNLPSSMGCIVRTAGLARTKTEIKRDFDYLARLWDDIRELTLKSSAPALIHNDSDLIKRAIRDIYNRDIEEVLVEGEHGYRAARDYMKLLMPSHAKRVKPYADAVPLYQRYGVEDQLNALYQPVVQLKSGGYLVINPTEALVSIDINSGRSTREHGIEQTATSTNLEAAQEIARQLRLRDMAGLVVIDFIDMEHNSNVRKVERTMKAALADDRARIQVGRISSFGLMEMSRQRLRTGVLEASTRSCPHCEGTGLVRTASSAALSALRMLEDEAARGKASRLTLRASQEAAFYVLNRKRAELGEVELRYGVTIDIMPDGEVEGGRMSVEANGPPPQVVYQPLAPIIYDEEDEDIIDDVDDEEEELAEAEARSRQGDRGGRDGERGDGQKRKRSRRRRGRRGSREEGSETGGEVESGPRSDEENAADTDVQDSAIDPNETAAEGEARRKRSRRGRRGGRRRGGDDQGGTDAVADDTAEAVPEPVAEAEPEPAAKPVRGRRKKADALVEADGEVMAPAADPAPEKPKRGRKPKVETAPVEGPAVEAAPEPEAEPAEKPKRGRAKKVVAAEAPPVAAPVVEAVASAEPSAEDGPPRRGWWQRTFGATEE